MVITQYRGWTVTFQICTMYTAFLDKEIFHQSPGRHLRWHWMHPLRCLCCSWCCAAELVLLCTKLRSCRNRQHSHTTQHNWRICRPKQNLHLELLGKLLWSEEFSRAWSIHVTWKLFVIMMERNVYTIVCRGSNLDIVRWPSSTVNYYLLNSCKYVICYSMW